MVMMKKTKFEKSFDIFNFLILLFLCFLMLYPFLYVVSHSMMPSEERALNPFSIIPQSFDFSGYKYILSSGSMLLNGYKITIFRVVVGSLLSLLCECMMAYALSKKYYPLRTAVTFIVAFTMWFSAGLIPFFITVNNLGLSDSLLALVLPRLVSVWNLLILRNFFMQLPESLEESARIDGANDFTVLFKVVLPLSTPVLATIALFHMVEYWNEWFQALLFINDKMKTPVMIILRQILTEANQAAANEQIRDVTNAPPTVLIQMASVVVVAFPIIVVYPFFQKHFVKGMLIGSIKG